MMGIWDISHFQLQNTITSEDYTAVSVIILSGHANSPKTASYSFANFQFFFSFRHTFKEQISQENRPQYKEHKFCYHRLHSYKQIIREVSYFVDYWFIWNGWQLRTYWHLWQTYLPRPTAFASALHSWHSARPWLRIKPWSASSLSHISQRKQRGCQLEFMALITRPITNSPAQRKKHKNSSY
jgi:hypothetical protein